MKDLRKQKPSNPNNWLHNGAADFKRVFTKLVILSKDAKPWEECSNEAKEKWEANNPVSLPSIPEPKKIALNKQ